jgi:hypothetical protein
MGTQLGFLTLSAILSKVAEKKVEEEAKKSSQVSLRDFVHETFPNLSKYEQCIDVLPIVLAFVTLWIAVQKHPSLNLSEMIQNIAIILFFRTVMTSVTILPSPICTIRKSYAIGGCNDCIFSGHTALTLVFAYYIAKCYPRKTKSLLMYSLLTSLLIIITRSHYTIDVIVAWFVVYAVVVKDKASQNF